MSNEINKLKSEIEALKVKVNELNGIIKIYDSHQDLKYCDTHELGWVSSNSCPWCQRDKLFDEIELIKEVFDAAVSAHESSGGQQAPYHGDFCNIPTSVAKDMEYWIERWEKIIPEEFEP